MSLEFPRRDRARRVRRTPVGGDKWAEWDHRELLRACVLQRRLHQPAGDILALQGGWYFGVDEEDRVLQCTVHSLGVIWARMRVAQARSLANSLPASCPSA